MEVNYNSFQFLQTHNYNFGPKCVIESPEPNTFNGIPIPVFIIALNKWYCIHL